MDGRARGRSAGGGGDRAGRVPAAGLRAERAGPGRRARSHPRRGPRAQRRALGGPARGPRSMPPPPAAALLLAGAARGAAAGAARRLPPRAGRLRAQLSPPARLAGRGSRAARAFSARVAAFALCASEADPGCPFPPALTLRGRKQTRQRSEAPGHACAGGAMAEAAPPSEQSQIKRCHPAGAPLGATWLCRRDLRFFQREI